MPVEVPNSDHLHRLAAVIDDALDEVAEVAADEIFAEVPGYRGNTAPRLHEDVVAHCREVFAQYVRALREARVPGPSEFTTTVDFALRRVGQSVPITDFLRAFRVAQIRLWETVLELANTDVELRNVALESVGFMMAVFENGATNAAAAYVEAERYLVADAVRAVRDLVEDLLSGRAPITGPRQAAVHSAGLSASSHVVVLSARTVGERSNRRTVLRALGQAYASHRRGLTTIRQGEIIGIVPVSEGGPQASIAELTAVIGQLSEQGIELSAGVSMPVVGLESVGAAHRAAVIARESLQGAAGIQSFDRLSPLDYLVSRPDETAPQVIPERVRRFVIDDMNADSVYIDTLMAYVDANLNAKAAAETLFIHSNTAYYRIERIAERTGMDLRNVREVLDLYVAVRLLR